jgi:ADP-ribose pyrophosphatase YjhB (NUDIX family)
MHQTQIDVNRRKKKHVFELRYNFCPQCGKQISLAMKDGKKVLHCHACNFSFWNNPNPVVSALIRDQKQILLIKRAGEVYKNYWALPGGVIDYMEEPTEAILREIKEETGLTGSAIKLFDAYLIVYAPKGLTKLPSHTSIDIVFEVSINNKSPGNYLLNPTPEASSIRFYRYDFLPQRIAFGHRNIINKYFKNLYENTRNRRHRIYRKPSYQSSTE